MDIPPAPSSDDDEAPLAISVNEDALEASKAAAATVAKPVAAVLQQLAPVPVTLITGVSNLRPFFFDSDVIESPASV